MSDTQKHTKPNVPNLRFPGFEGEWETKKLSAYLYENKERNRNGEFNKSDVLSVSGDCGIVNQIELLGRSFAGKSVADYHVVRTDDIVYTKSPLKEYPYGIVKYNNGKDGIVSTLYAVYHHKNNVDGQFVEYYFTNPQRTNRYFKPIVRIGAKHDMKIGNEEVLDNFVIFPGLKEQRKITEMLSLLDQRIAIQNKVIEKYESLIKALAYEIIGKNVANKALSECVCCTSSTLKESDLGEDGVVPAYGAAGISGFTDSALSERDSILITKDGSGVGSLRYVHGPHSFVGTLNSMTPKDGIYLPYIYYALQNVCFETYRTGQAIPHIYFRDYGKEAIYCPAYDDQKRIAKGLELIDATIGIERAVLQNLQSAKASLLSGMFI